MELATVLIFVLVGLILAQTIVLLVVISKLNQEMKRSETAASRLAREVGDALTSISAGLGRADWIFRTLCA